MRKTLCRVLPILIVCAIAVLCVFCKGYDFLPVSCIDNLPALELVSCITGTENELEREDTAMYLVYQLARRNIVKVTVKSSAGSGIIWKINDDNIVIVSNKHILKNDVKANIVFCNGDEAIADVIGYSQQYDIGFVSIDKSYITDKLLRDIYEVVPDIYPSETSEDKAEFLQEYGHSKIIQVGVNYDNNLIEYTMGNVKELEFLPLFNTNIVVSNCYAKAGMSGGGVFDDRGKLIGMISGGYVTDESTKKESDITYSIPAGLISEEYEQILFERQD